MAVADDVDELLRVICDIQEIREMKVTCSHSLEAGACIGFAAMTGGLLFGPKGLFIGAFCSGLSAAILMDGKFESAPYILINRTSNEQKIRLAMAIKNVLKQRNILKIADFLKIGDTNDKSTIIGSIIRIVQGFLEEDLEATIKQILKSNIS